jgi:hypothetical protein
MRYAGCIGCQVEQIRVFRNASGHGFFVVHAPKEGIQHAEIGYNPAAGKSLDTTEKDELKLFLSRVFSKLLSHSCGEPKPEKPESLK